MVSMVSKLTARSLGDPRKVVVNAPESETRWLHGTIIGEATGISKRTAADGEKIHEGLQGVFEGVPVDPAGQTVRSSVLYFPEGMAENFLKVFRPADNYTPPNAMQIGVEVYLFRAKNPQGYSWELVPLVAAVDASDPLEIVRKKIADQRAAENKQLADKSEGAEKRKGK